jgi:hypothetical protein
MKSWLVSFFSRRVAGSKNRRRPSARPQLMQLEDRLAPALLNHGGPILTSVQAQALYLGSGWNAASIPTSQFDSFLSTIVSGTKAAPAPYIAMLKNGGFGADGSGRTLPGVADNIAVSSDLLDSQIQADLTAAIQNNPNVQQPYANTLYVVFVQPGVVVDLGSGQTSTNTFLAYHSSFTSSVGLIRYAVVPYHGTGGNAQASWLTSAFDSMTAAATHELAEAITDPDGTTWYDRSGNEIGDVVNGSTVYLNGYAVQREGSMPASLSNYLPMTPTGATAGHSAAFLVGANGVLDVSEAGGAFSPVANPSGETGKVVSVSKQGIDDFGQPMVDVVFSDSNAYEYHDFLPNNPTATANPSFFPWTPLSSNVKQAAAGQGVSYVLLTNGLLGEYVDPNYFTYYYGFGVNPGAGRNGAIASGVNSILAAGTDQVGGNAVEYTTVVRGVPTTHEWRDVTGAASSSTSGFKPSNTSKSGSPAFANSGNGTLDITQQSQPAQAIALLNTSVAPISLAPAGPGITLAQPNGGAPVVGSPFSTASNNVFLSPITPPPTGLPGNRVESGGGAGPVDDPWLPDDTDSGEGLTPLPKDAPVPPADAGAASRLSPTSAEESRGPVSVPFDASLGSAPETDGAAPVLPASVKECTIAVEEQSANEMQGLSEWARMVLCGVGGVVLTRRTERERPR